MVFGMGVEPTRPRLSTVDVYQIASPEHVGGHRRAGGANLIRRMPKLSVQRSKYRKLAESQRLEHCGAKGVTGLEGPPGGPLARAPAEYYVTRGMDNKPE